MRRDFTCKDAMQVTETEAEGLKREFKVLVPAADIEEQMTSRLKELAKTVRLPGFRPGKVPVGLLRKRYGPSVMGEVLEKTVNESSQKTMTERGLRPALEPRIEITGFDEGKDLEYTMAVEIMPEIEPLDFSEIKLERLVVPINDGDMDETLQQMAGAYKTSTPLEDDRESRAGDTVIIDFVGRVDGEEFAGGKAEGYRLELGSGSFIPGFEDQIVGAKAGDAVAVSVTFPEDYGAEALAGKEAVFDVTLNEIHETTPAAIDDDLAHKAGAENLAALRDHIRQDREKELKALSRMRLKRALLDALADAVDFQVPVGMVDSEFEGIWKQFEEQREAGGPGLDPEDAERSDDENKAEYRALAERRVRLGLLLSEVGNTNNIQVSQDDIGRALMEEARRHPGHEKDVIEHYRNSPKAMRMLTAPVYEDKVVDFILELADVSDREATLDDLLAEPEAPPAKKAAKKKAAKKAAAKKAPAKKKAAKKTAAKKTAAKKTAAKKDA
jgi:trigger factor